MITLLISRADSPQDVENVKQSPIEWSPMDVSKQIGLLKAYFEKKAADEDLVEVCDELNVWLINRMRPSLNLKLHYRKARCS